MDCMKSMIDFLLIIFFRLLLNNDFEYEDALSFILCNCALSTLVFQERIYNKYYLGIDPVDTLSPDLVKLRNYYLLKIIRKRQK